MRLSLRIQKLAYSVATAVALAGAVLVALWGLRPPGAPWDHADRDTGTPNPVPVALSEESPGPGRDEFAKLWDQPLRRELYDPPPPKPVVMQLPPLRVELLGTILEEANSLAIVRSEQGRVEYKRTGDTVGPADSPAQVVEIRADAVVLVRADERVTLKVNATQRR